MSPFRLDNLMETRSQWSEEWTRFTPLPPQNPQKIQHETENVPETIVSKERKGKQRSQSDFFRNLRSFPEFPPEFPCLQRSEVTEVGHQGKVETFVYVNSPFLSSLPVSALYQYELSRFALSRAFHHDVLRHHTGAQEQQSQAIVYWNLWNTETKQILTYLHGFSHTLWKLWTMIST